jgi:hypothetical protein
MSTGQGASLNGFIPSRQRQSWNKDISAQRWTPLSAIINFIGPSIGLHPILAQDYTRVRTWEFPTS